MDPYQNITEEQEHLVLGGKTSLPFNFLFHFDSDILWLYT